MSVGMRRSSKLQREARGFARRREAGMSDPWSERAELYRTSTAHSCGPRPRPVVEWAGGARPRSTSRPAAGTSLGGCGRRGSQVVSCDPAPGMKPDVICFAEELPFADSSFDLAVTRVAAHHFADVGAASAEIAPGRANRVLVVDTSTGGEDAERAEKLRDPSHVRNYTEAGVARTSSPRPVSRSRRSHASTTRSSSSRGSRAPAAKATTAAEVRAPARRPDRGRDLHVRPDRPPRGRPPDGDPRRHAARASSCRASPAARAASTGCETASHGTNVVAGVTPGKGGQDVEGIPVFGTVADAVAETGANTSLVFVPAALRG